MDSVEVHGLRIAYERVGAGPPLVLLHGYVGDGPTTWQPQLEGLSDAFTVIAWDAPGAGASDDPPEDIGLAGYADCLAAFLTALALGPCTVAGLSFGGPLALELAGRHPDAATARVVASGYAGWVGSLGASASEARLHQALQLSALAPAALVDVLMPGMFAARVTPEVVASFARSVGAVHLPVGLRAMALAMAVDRRDRLASLALPVLVVTGALDQRAPVTAGEALRDAISGSQLAVLPDVGHVCNLEAPDAFNAIVRAFLLAVGPTIRPV